MFCEENKPKECSQAIGEKQRNIIDLKMAEEEDQSSKLELCTTNFYYAFLKCKKDTNSKF